MNLGIDMGRRHGVSRGERRFDGIRVDRDLGLIGMRGVVNGDTLRHVEPLQLTRLLKHGLPAAPRIAATKAELRRDCNRSEEHTSELQSLMRISYAVFCLKKQTKSETKTSRTK